jgi:predicted RNA-binding protein YlxR (DUF448 family)
MRVEPTRTCVGCRRTGSKAGLVRIARAGDGVALDRSGRAPGRGAYCHPEPDCVRAAFAAGVLARALRTGLGPDELGRLRNEIETGAL